MMKLNNVARREENERSRHRKPCCTSASAGNARHTKARACFCSCSAGFTACTCSNASKQSGLPEYDEYIPGEKREPIGLYKLTHDDEGNPIIEFDDPMKADNVSPQEAEGPSKEAAPAKGEPGRKAETCTTNTDKVDREIEKLKEERDQLEQQIRTTKDPDKAEDLKRQLAQLENELRQKDNDAYRRQNAVIS